ncbi:MAG: amidohydrolase [Spirochaetaceae bacterium]|jgi:amidohydrolase|nr:amidohydrolase [Spirochaetaceae bacterium]
MDKKNLEMVTALRKELHTQPELSRNEVWTRKRLMDFLRQHTSLKIVDKGHWFYAVHEGGTNAPKIGFRADMDAVAINETLDLPYASRNPGVSHKCGHDGHSAGLAGFALELDRIKPKRTIYLIFQHAEENGEGAKECAALIDECGITEVFGLHNWPGMPKGCVALRDGTVMCASFGLTITMTGASTHASTPEKGKNPAQALAKVILEIPKITNPALYNGLIMATIIHSEVGTPGAFGVAASCGSLSVTCRALLDEDLNALEKRLCEFAKDAAAKDGLTCEFSIQDRFPETANHKTSAERVRQAARKLGFPLQEMKEPIRSSEDFGYYLKRAEGAFFFLGAGDGPGLHSSEYDFPDELIEPGVEIFKAIAGI